MKTNNKTPKRLWLIIIIFILPSFAAVYDLIYGNEVSVFPSIIVLSTSALVSLGLYFRINVVRAIAVLLIYISTIATLIMSSLTLNIAMEVPTLEWAPIGILTSLIIALFIHLGIISYLTADSTKTLFGRNVNIFDKWSRRFVFSSIALMVVGTGTLVASGNFARIFTTVLFTHVINSDDDTKTYISKKERTFKKGEKVIYSPSTPLPVLGTDTSICFFLGTFSEDEADKITNEIFKHGGNSNKKIFDGYVISSDEKNVPLTSVPSVGSGPSTFNSKTKDVTYCSQVIFDGASCCVGIMPRNERVKKVHIPDNIKTISFVVLDEFKALSVYWRTSKRDENMSKVWEEGAERDNNSPFITRPYYKKFHSIFSSEPKIGDIQMETQHFSFSLPKNMQRWRETGNNDFNYPVSENIEGVILSFSKENFFITPKDSELANAHTIKLSSKDIHSCSASCSSREFPWRAKFIIENPEYIIEIDDGYEYTKWCWENRIPILSSSAESDWYYKGESLPVLNDDSQFSSYEEYKKRLNKVCAGY